MRLFKRSKNHKTLSTLPDASAANIFPDETLKKIAKLTEEAMMPMISNTIFSPPTMAGGNSDPSLITTGIDPALMNANSVKLTPKIPFGHAAATSYPQGTPEDNMELMKNISCIQNVETDDWNMVVSFSIKIGGDDIYNAEKKEISEGLKRKIDLLRKRIDEALRNKKTLIDLLS